MVRQTATEKSTGPTLLVGVDVLQTLGGVAGTQARVPWGCAKSPQTQSRGTKSQWFRIYLESMPICCTRLEW